MLREKLKTINCEGHNHIIYKEDKHASQSQYSLRMTEQ